MTKLIGIIVFVGIPLAIVLVTVVLHHLDARRAETARRTIDHDKE